MDNKDKVQYLIVDTSAFIKNTALQDIGINILTEQAVVNEITSKRQLRRLVVLPYDLNIREAFPENIKFVTEFAKKTGDYISLSATDIKVIALTYQLEKEKVGIEHIKTAPTIRKTITATVHKENENNPNLLIGFYAPKEEEQIKLSEDNNIEISLNNIKKMNIKQNDVRKQERQPEYEEDISSNEQEFNYETKEQDITEQNAGGNLTERFAKLACNPTDIEVENEIESKYIVDDILTPIDIKSDSVQSDMISVEDEDNDNGWITPGNIINVKNQMDSDILKDKAATVACLTMDFAMQNVLIQMGLNVATLDGKVIKQMRTFIFRCYACFKTTSVMTKVFCPNCGNKTLKKVEVTLDENGKQQIHINFRRPLSAKGKKFSLPMPKGGKHANNPILYEDQPMPEQRSSRLARTKNNPLDDDYTAGYSPFIMRDVNSRSAILGIRTNDAAIKYWMKRNPNESRRRQK